MNSQEDNRLYMHAKLIVRQKNIFWSDVINFLVFSFIFFGFNMIFTPGLWWSIIPIGIYVLTIVAIHAGRVQALREEESIEAEMKKLKKLENKTPFSNTFSPHRGEEKSLIKSQSIWDEEEMV